MDNQTPTQTQYPAQAAKRTLASLIASVPLVVAALAGLSESIHIVNEVFGASIPESVSTTLVVIAGVFIGIATAVTRIMANPSVNKFLTKLNLGAQPKKVAAEAQAILDGQIYPYNVLPEPKAEVTEVEPEVIIEEIAVDETLPGHTIEDAVG